MGGGRECGCDHGHRMECVYLLHSVTQVKNLNTILTLAQYAPQTLTGNLWENVSLAVQYAPDLRHSILYFFFKPHCAYNNRSALTLERTNEPTYLLVLYEWT